MHRLRGIWIRLALFSALLPCASTSLLGQAGHFAVVSDRSDASLYLIDGTTNAVVGPVLSGQLGPGLIDQGLGHLGIAFTPDGRTALVSNPLESRVYFVEFSNASFPTSTGWLNVELIAGDVAVTPDGRYAVVGGLIGQGEFPDLAVIDLVARRVLRSFDISPRSAQAVAVAPDGQTVLVLESREEEPGRLHVFLLDPLSGRIVDTRRSFDLGARARDVVVGPDGRTVLALTLDTQRGVQAFRINGPGELEAAGTLDGIGAYAAAFHPDGTRAYVLDVSAFPNRLAELAVAGAADVEDTGRRLDVASEAPGDAPFGPGVLAVSGDGTRAYVSEPWSQAPRPTPVSVVDLEAWRLVRTVEAGVNPTATAVNTAFGASSVAITAVPTSDPQSDEPVELEVRVSGDFSPVTGLIYYGPGRGRDETFVQEQLQPEGDVFTTVIPEAYMTPRGVDYVIVLSDRERSVTYPAVDPLEYPAHLQVGFDDWPVPFELEAATYRMVSVPMELERPGLRAVLEDDLGPYEAQEWALFRWSSSARRYLSLAELETGFEPGLAYWIASLEAAGFDLDDARSVDPNVPRFVTLVPGWNQVANPFAFSVSGDDVEEADEIEDPVLWDPVLGEYVYGETVVRPWEGYFVYNPTEEEVVVRIPDSEAESFQEFGPEEIGFEKRAGASVPFDEAVYTVQVTARSTEREVRDTQNFLALGTGPGGQMRHEAPAFGEGLRLSIVEDGDRLAGRMKPASEEGQAWDLELEGGFDGTPFPVTELVEVDFLESGMRPQGHDLYVVDLDRNRMLPVQDGRLRLDVVSGRTRSLRVLLGTPAFAEERADGIPLHPEGTELEAVYPNPFAREAQIPYRLEEQARVRLTVYDLLGRPVRVLVDAVREPGAYGVRWDGAGEEGRELAAGVYLVRLEAGAFAAVRSVTLVR